GLGDVAAGMHVLGQPDIAADDAALAQGNPSQDGGAGVYDHIVFDDGMSRQPLLQRAVLVGGKALGAQGDRLVDAHAFADDGGFADDYAGAVIDEEAAADLGAGVDVDTRLAVGQFGSYPGQEGQALAVQLVRDPMVDHGFHAGIAQQHFVDGARGRVAMVGGQGVAVEQAAYLGQRQDQVSNCLGRPGLHGDVSDIVVVARQIAQLEPGLVKQGVQGGF